MIVLEAVAAWNAHDVDRYAATLEDDCIVEAPDGLVGRGHDAARKMLQSWFNGFPDLRFDITRALLLGERVFTSWVATGTPRAAVRHAPSRPLEAHGCAVVDLKNGKIGRIWNYWDTDDVSRYVQG
jgi:steroid delta-isomerase-like uncharacterized protein